MEAFLEILKIILPAVMVFVATYIILKSMLENDHKKREHELKKNNASQTSSTTLPLKIQAFERLVIYLERINPNTLVVRTNKNGMSTHQLQIELVRTIKSEYEHNLSQQIYISPGSWELVKTAKEELIKLINISATKVHQDAPSNELAMMILNIAANLEKKLPNDVALEYIKREASQIL